ncbi:Putative exopolysaccharide biosynthesis protein [Oxalobacteraceae bacterium IMCC9480]|nr:Putative exopolysaccharide biosynthesis protein [Oxalobacteraceae bacterium IMCC9480]
MNLSQLLFALRARYKLILLTLVLTVTATVVVSLLLPKTYLASTALVVNYKGVDQVTGLSLLTQMQAGYVATQVDIIKSKSVAFKVIDELRLADSPAVQQQFLDATNGVGTIRDWLANLLLANVDVIPSRESSVLTIVFKGSEPQFVSAVANAFAKAYMQLTVQLKTEPAQQASGYINTQIKELRDRYEQSQNRLSDYQQKNNIFSADNRVDVETARLNELSSQLVQVQGLAMEAVSRQRQATGNAGESPDVQNNPLIQGLKSSLAIAEAKFSETSKRLAENHPQYISAKAEVDKMRATLNEQVMTASASVATSARIYQQREAELRSALTTQKTKVMALNGARDEFNILTNETENTRRAYEAASQRFNQTSLESQSKQADIAVLTAATEPTTPSGPRVLLNSALSFVVGLLLGVGAALGMEFLDQRIRSASQLSETFGLPVLGIIEKSRAISQKRSYKPLRHPGDGFPMTTGKT